MLRQAIATAAIWLAFVVALDLPLVLAASGVAFAFLFAWWDEQKRLAAHADEVQYADEFEDDENETFEQTPPIFYA